MISSKGEGKVNEEDLDDLDDVLEEFTKPPPLQPQLTQTIPPSTLPPNALPTDFAEPPESAEDEEFAKRLAAEMEAMMRAIGGDANTVAEETDPETLAQQEAYREAWNKLLIQDLEGDGKGNGLESLLRGPETSSAQSKGGEGGSTSKDDGKADESAEDPFQKAIRQAMEKLQDSDDTLKASSQDAGQDTLESLMSSLKDLNLGEGEGGEDIESLLETMMSQLMSKEILYEPLKELDTKYPEYLSEHNSTLSQEDLKRYTDQKERVSQIISIFENPTYSDDNAAQGVEVLRLMNEMQSFGSPPSEIMGPMPAGFEFGADGLPKLPDGCVIT